MTSDLDPRRLHPAALLVMLKDKVGAIAFLLLLAVVNADGWREMLATNGVYLALIPAVVVASVVRWGRFRYWFEADRFRAVDGALVRRQIYIPLDKIQAVNVTVGPIQRLFGVVKFEVKTAASGTQAELSAITVAEADRLRAFMRPGAQSLDAPSEPDDAPGAKVYRLAPRQLLLAGATSGQLGVVFGLVAWVFSQVSEPIIELLVDNIESIAATEDLPATNPGVIAAIVVVGLVVSWVVSMAWEIIRYGGLTTLRRRGDLVISRGLFERRQVTIPAHRVQAVRYRETLLRQPFGYGTLYIEAIGHAEEKGTSTILHPFIHREACRKMIADVLPQFDVEIEYMRPPRRALPRFLIAPSVLAAAPLVVGTWFVPWVAVGFTVLPLIWLIGYVSWRDTGLSTSDDIAVVRSRSARHRTTAILRRDATQKVRTTASVMQRRRDVTSVHLTVATGALGHTFTARDLDDGDAWRALQWGC